MGTEPTGVTRLKFCVVIRINDLRMEIFPKKNHKMLFNVSIGFEVCQKILKFSSFIRLIWNLKPMEIKQKLNVYGKHIWNGFF